MSQRFLQEFLPRFSRVFIQKLLQEFFLRIFEGIFDNNSSKDSPREGVFSRDYFEPTFPRLDFRHPSTSRQLAFCIKDRARCRQTGGHENQGWETII